MQIFTNCEFDGMNFWRGNKKWFLSMLTEYLCVRWWTARFDLLRVEITFSIFYFFIWWFSWKSILAWVKRNAFRAWQWNKPAIQSTFAPVTNSCFDFGLENFFLNFFPSRITLNNLLNSISHSINLFIAQRFFTCHVSCAKMENAYATHTPKT